MLVDLYLTRHHSGDWGDVSADDAQANTDGVGTKSIPVVFLPWPSPGRDDEWFVAAKQKYVDVSDGKEPWILLTHSASEEAEWPDSAEVLTLNLSDVARPTIAVCGVTRAPKSELRWLRIDAGACDGPVPSHAWIG